MKKASDLLSRVAVMQEQSKERAKKQQDMPQEMQNDVRQGDGLPKNVIKLPAWPEAVRGVPNGVLRSALFGVIQKGARRYMEREQIHAQDGITIRYTGARLDQGDLDVWTTVLHMARLQDLGDECRVKAYQILKALGKTDCGKNRTTLDCRLSRLKATGLDVKVGKYSYEGSLIDEVYRAEESKEYVIRLNPKLRSLFEKDQFTQVEWAVRHALDRKPLAQWLHGYYSSHAEPYPLKIETLRRLCGSETEELWKFTQTLKKALDDVSNASAAHGQRFSYSIENGGVCIEKKVSGAQRRHLAKKAAAKRK